jgi:phage baseplate assembly protein W
MPTQVKKIQPLDLQPRKAIGVSIPFSAAGVFNSTYQSKDAIKVNLLNFILTGIGERYFNPTFGTNLRRYLFENITQSQITNLVELLRERISTFFPTVNIISLLIQGEPDTNTLTLYLKYNVRNTIETTDEININFLQ